MTLILLRSPESNRAGGAFLVFDTIARRAARAMMFGTSSFNKDHYAA
jgi:hypothetical protein